MTKKYKTHVHTHLLLVISSIEARDALRVNFTKCEVAGVWVPGDERGRVT